MRTDMQNLTTVELAILHELRRLTDSQQEHLLGFIQSILPKPDTNSSNLLHFAGAFDTDDLNDMQSSISEDCGNIDIDEW